jgi:NAD(P)-dependent dehydrogenase (short-subunit alcohol dehydrogenase family)
VRATVEATTGAFGRIDYLISSAAANPQFAATVKMLSIARSRNN